MSRILNPKMSFAPPCHFKNLNPLPSPPSPSLSLLYDHLKGKGYGLISYFKITNNFTSVTFRRFKP